MQLQCVNGAGLPKHRLDYIAQLDTSFIIEESATFAEA
jgi:hypothetical protein